MIEVQNFCKEYKSHSKTVFKVQDVCFTVEKGSITGLVGPNGSGKSTVIKAICGFHYPTSGHIFITDNENQRVDICEQSEKAMENTAIPSFRGLGGIFAARRLPCQMPTPWARKAVSMGSNREELRACVP